MSLKLRDLIRNVRACKTAAEERDVIAKECAEIRTAFKSKQTGPKLFGDDSYRHRNVAKLLYIHMLGYPTHFGQMEAMKLVASNRFAEKRIGYLALMILLDESQDVLMLVTNSLQNDMANKNPYVAGLALCALGNISSADIARDLSRDVSNLLLHQNPYIRKKAALCAVRIIRKVPDLVDDFMHAAPQLLAYEDHATKLTGVSLLLEICHYAPHMIPEYRSSVLRIFPTTLRSLYMNGYMSEYDVMGITDPFLQTNLIKLARVLCEGDADSSALIGESLAQIIINTDATRVPGAAILYECVQTILAIEAEGGLRVLAMNVLGKFLQSKDNNIRYVALNTLCKVVHRDVDAIQRHRNVVVDCLKDTDISIRRRALNLIYALVTKNNVKALVKELLNYLNSTSGGPDFKMDLTDKICVVVEKFAPNRVWHISTLVQVLCTAGNVVKEDTLVDFTVLVSKHKNLHYLIAFDIFNALNNTDNMKQQGLMQVGLWCLGEFGHYLINSENAANATTLYNQEMLTEITFSPYARLDVVALVETILNNPHSVEVTKQYALNTLVKLSAHYNDEQVNKKIVQILKKYARHNSIELQQRAVEYIQAITNLSKTVKDKVLARMPLFTRSNKKFDFSDSTDDAEDAASLHAFTASDSHKSDSIEQASQPQQPTVPEPAPTPAPANNVVDLLDLLGGGAGVTNTNSNSSGSFDIFDQMSVPAPASTSNSLDILTNTNTNTNTNTSANIMDLFNTPQQPQLVTFPSEKILDKNGLLIMFNFSRTPNNPAVLFVDAVYSNSSPSPLSNFDFQVAVPPHITKELLPSSSRNIPENNSGAVTQRFILTNTLYGQKRTVMKARILYTVNGNNIVEQLSINQFPQ